MQPQNDMNSRQNANGQLSDNSGVPTKTHFVNMDSFVSFISKKTEQIATALYLVSDTIETNDPIRHHIREKSVELVSSGKSMDLLSAIEKHFEFHAMKSLLGEVEACLSIAHMVGDVSKMNHTILTNESKKLIEAIDIVLSEERTNGFTNPTLMDDATSNFIFNTFQDTPFVSETAESKHETPHTQPPVSETQNKKILTDRPSAQTDTKSKGHTKTKGTPDKSVTDMAIHHNRRQSIIKIITQNKSASLSDIRAVIVDVSEKTLQRELVSLIDEGVVLKVGDKRWARYTLVS